MTFASCHGATAELEYKIGIIRVFANANADPYQTCQVRITHKDRIRRPSIAS